MLNLPKPDRTKNLVRPLPRGRSYTGDQRAEAKAILAVTEPRRTESVKQALVKGAKRATKRLEATQQPTSGRSKSKRTFTSLGRQAPAASDKALNP